MHLEGAAGGDCVDPRGFRSPNSVVSRWRSLVYCLERVHGDRERAVSALAGITWAAREDLRKGSTGEDQRIAGAQFVEEVVPTSEARGKLKCGAAAVSSLTAV